MKKIIIIAFFSFVAVNSFAQGNNRKTNFQNEEDPIEEGWFKKDHLFTGGDLTLAFGNSFTALGASPYFGYSINKYLDAAISINYTYTSQRDYYELGDKVRQTIYGPGSFIRIYPLKFLFAQLQYEMNFIRLKYIPRDNFPSYYGTTENINVNSLLLGFGYAGGRSPESNSFYYFSVCWDLIKNRNSPYVDGLGRAIPIIRAGYNIALFQGRRNR